MTSTQQITALTQQLLETLQQQTIEVCMRQLQTSELFNSLGLEQRTQEIVQTLIASAPKSDFEQEMRAQTETTEQIMTFLQEVLQDHQGQMDDAQSQILGLKENIDSIKHQVKRLEKENLAFRTEISNNRMFVLDRLNSLQEDIDRK